MLDGYSNPPGQFVLTEGGWGRAGKVEKKSTILKMSQKIYIFLWFSVPLEEFIRHFLRKMRKI